MITRPNTNKQRMKRHKRVRAKISGTPVCPRLNVFRSEANIYAQIIDDVNGVTLASASSLDKAIEGYGGNVTAASAVGKLIAERALAKGIENVVFDRGGYLYHGRVQALPDEPLIALKQPGVKTSNNHGTGCTLSAAIATYLGLGLGIRDAIVHAQKFLNHCLRHGYAPGLGAGPPNHASWIAKRVGE